MAAHDFLFTHSDIGTERSSPAPEKRDSFVARVKRVLYSRVNTGASAQVADPVVEKLRQDMLSEVASSRAVMTKNNAGDGAHDQERLSEAQAKVIQDLCYEVSNLADKLGKEPGKGGITANAMVRAVNLLLVQSSVKMVTLYSSADSGDSHTSFFFLHHHEGHHSSSSPRLASEILNGFKRVLAEFYEAQESASTLSQGNIPSVEL